MTFTAFHILAAGELGWTALAFNAGLILVLVVLSGAFSCSETVLFSLSRLQLERATASPNPFRRMAARLMREPKRTLMTILLANTAVNVLLFATSYVLFDGLAERVGGWVRPVSGFASVLLVVVCGEVVPKVVGVSLAERLAPFSAAVVRVTGTVAGPLGRVIDLVLAEPFVRVVLGRRGRSGGEADLSREELKALLEMSRKGGTIKPLEDTFLRAVVDLEHLRVRDVMIPRVEMIAYDVNEPAEGLRELMRSSRFKKIPVYDGSLDQIAGLVYAKVLFFNPDKTLRELVVPARFVPELITCGQLLHHFRATRTQLAIAVDEYGGVAGLVTLEDVLEKIVGDLAGPDEEPEEPEIVAEADGTYTISGQLSIHNWGEVFGLSSLAERVVTVGGLVMARLGRPAQVGDVVRLGNVELEVTQVVHRRIERLRLRLLNDAPPAEGGAA